MSSPERESQVRFDARQMYQSRGPALSATPLRDGERPHGRRVVHDARFGRCLVWRPVEGPPLPRRHAARTPLPPHPSRLPHRVHTSEQASGHQTHVAAWPDHDSTVKHDTDMLALTSSTPAASKRAEADTLSPPRGQLLRRGKGGIDDVLKNARAAQSLFYSLQERRLKAEYRSTQEELKHELDQQRQYKRMLELSAYQEELVNLYGPSMRDIIADVFFDDGHDPVLALLKAKREAPLSLESAAFVPPANASQGAPPPRQLWQRSEDAASTLLLRDAAASRRDRASNEREMLHRALDERRSGRRTNY